MKRTVPIGVLCLCAAAMAPGCGPAPRSVYERLQDESPAVRVRAAIEAGDARDARAVPYLVDRLTDSEPAVRMFAIVALEKITGTRRGFDYRASRSRQEEAAAKWREWLREPGGPSAATQPQEGARS